jgi:predicted nucleotidyltransferase
VVGEYVTLAERKAAKVAAMTAAVEELMPVLADYARTHGGRFILFGSAARNELRYHSDVDILIDFPIEKELDAWLFAEAQCFQRDLRPDLHIRAWCTDWLIQRAEREGRVLQ